MVDRRQHPRYVLNPPLTSTLRITEDVIVERVAGDEMWVLSDAPGRPDERLMVDRVGSAPPLVLGARVLGSDPVVVRGRVRHRLRLSLIPPDQMARDAGIESGLVRSVPMTILDVSRGGCLLQTNIPVEPGVRGELLVRNGGAECWDPLRVSRCVQVEGGNARYRIGAEFLRLPHEERFGVRINQTVGSLADEAARTVKA